MARYYDSSLILSAVLEERDDFDVDFLWDAETNRISSALMKIECLIAIRRAGQRQNLSPEDPWRVERIDAVDRFLGAITFKQVDDTIEQTIRSESRLSRCRSLDAIHLATAQYFSRHLDEPLHICTLDKRMREVADELGFQILPAEL